MHQRPRLFIYLALLHFLEPFSKILYFKIMTRFPLLTIMQNVLAVEGFKNIFDFWLLFPLGGLMLLLVKRWSYMIFMAIQCYSVYSIANYQEYTWPYIAKTPLFSSLLLLTFNLGVILYFVMPGIRAYFFDRRMRWWETRPRYNFEIDLDVIGPNTITGHSQICNISLTGVFILDIPNLSPNDTVKLIFDHQNHHFEITGIIRNRRMMNGITGLGIEFTSLGFKDYWRLRTFIRLISTGFKNSYLEAA